MYDGTPYLEACARDITELAPQTTVSPLAVGCEEHPGGASSMLLAAGIDASEDFEADTWRAEKGRHCDAMGGSRLE